MPTPNELFGKRLAKLRKEKGYSQQELADMMKTSKTTVTNWETGRFKPTWDKLDTIAAILDVPISALIDKWEYWDEKILPKIKEEEAFEDYLSSLGYVQTHEGDEDYTVTVTKGKMKVVFSKAEFEELQAKYFDLQADAKNIIESRIQNKKPPTVGKQ